MALRVDIGVFAHNEAGGIAACLAALQAQDIFARDGVKARLVVLANGCSDATVAVARAAGAEVADLPKGGKSRTWNRFVHDLARWDADVLVFCDADITLPDHGALWRLVIGAGRQGIWAFNSQPVKDTVYAPVDLTVMDKIIASAAGGLDDWKTAICGQLYAMPATRARAFHLPIGLPVEDGFLRAMLLTDALTIPEDFSRIDGGDVFHVYPSERGVATLIRHQVRIVIGSAINAACFAHLRRLPASQRAAELARAAGDEAWLSRVIRAELPRGYGYVPPHFLTKRVARALARPRDLLRPKRLLLTVLGAGFDLIVYAIAQYKMARGVGAGFW